MRVPLTSLIGFSRQLCSDAEMSVEERGMIRDILKENSEKLMNLVNNVLDISRLESGKMKYTISPFDLVETCKLAEFQLKNSPKSVCRLELECGINEPIMLNHDQQRMLKCICASINIPSYVHIPSEMDAWTEKMILSVENGANGIKEWNILIESIFFI